MRPQPLTADRSVICRSHIYRSELVPAGMSRTARCRICPETPVEESCCGAEQAASRGWLYPDGWTLRVAGFPAAHSLTRSFVAIYTQKLQFLPGGRLRPCDLARNTEHGRDGVIPERDDRTRVRTRWAGNIDVAVDESIQL